MFVYVAGILATIAIGWFGMRTEAYRQGKKLPTVFISMLPLFLIAALRYDVGTDYMYMYVPYFQALSAGKTLRSIEPLYYLINQIVVWMGGHYQWVFAICAFLFTAFVFLQIFKDSPYPLLSIFLLCGMTYYFVSLNATRQMVGCAILLYSLRFVEERKWKQFTLAVLLAVGFHYICGLFAVVYLVSRWKIKPLYAVGLFVLCFVFAGPLSKLALFVIQLTPYGEKYIGSVFDKSGQRGYFILAIQVVVLLFAAWQYRDDKRYQMYFNLHWINTCVAAFAGYIVLTDRVRWVFGLPSIILLPMALKNIQDTRLRFCARVGIVVCFAAYAYIVIGMRGGHEVLPYQTIFGR